MNAQIHPALVRLKAIQEQKRRFEKWKAKFSQILSRHLNNLFIHMVNLKNPIHYLHSYNHTQYTYSYFYNICILEKLEKNRLINSNIYNFYILCINIDLGKCELTICLVII